VGVEKSHCVLVGDTLTDSRCARNASIGFIGVSWGYNKPEILLEDGAVAVLTDFAELPDIISTHLTG
jgi:phosphoglycolate phosphatase-like HAD superfamily hydrolase